MKCDGIIFDMDGTIWDSRVQVCESWNQAFDELQIDKRIDVEELSGYMGLPMDELGRKLFPKLSDQEIGSILESCYAIGNRDLYEKGAILYPGLEETILELYKNKRLFIVSNCQSGYIEAFLHAHKMEEYFEDLECYGNTELSKDKNIELIVDRNLLKNPVYVGDTQGDANAAGKAGVPFIYASYGFGEVKHYQEKIEKVSDILDLIKE